MATVDTVGDRYYQPVRLSEKVGTFLFWGSGVLSICAATSGGLKSNNHLIASLMQTASDALSVAFPTFVVALFFQGIAHRLYFLPRAEEARRANFLSDGYGVNISDEVTEGYYNNGFKGSPERVAANCMESAFFTASISKKMLTSIRVWSSIYLILYLALLLSKSASVDIIEVAAGVLFSEAVLSNWFRCEFLRNRSEDVYDKLRRLFVDNPGHRGDHWTARAHELLLRYETAKAISAITVSSKHYHRMNKSLSAEWGRRRETLGF